MELLKQQDENIALLQHAIKTYKKSPSDRKSLTYLQQQLTKLSELFKQVNIVDNQIRKDTTIPQTHEYYTSNLYATIGSMYNDAVDKIKHEIEELKKSEVQSASTSKGSSAVTSRLPGKLQKGIQAVNSLIQQVNQDPEIRSDEFIAMKLRTIEQHWHLIQQLHEQLWTSADDDYDLQEFLRQEARISEGILGIRERFKTTNCTNVDQKPARGNEVKLPSIELPRFDGNSLKWRQYRDLFIEMVHKQQLSGCQKLWYLKGSLTGEAARLIQHFPTTSENYTAAWQIIEGRYENKRVLVGALLQRLLAQQPAHKDSAASTKALHDTTLECLLGIRALGIPTDQWDPVIVHILSQLMDRQTQMLWEQSLTQPRELPKLQELMHFLELRFQSMEVVGSIKKYPQPSPNSLITALEVCLACKQTHALYQCQKFLCMSNKQRLQLVQSAKGCVNCLKTDHKTAQCASNKNCQQCHKRHNTLLHLEIQQGTKKGKLPSSSAAPVAKHVEDGIKATKFSIESASALLTASQRERSSALLSTVILTVEDIYGQPIECRAILDNGSQVHLITQNLANKLGWSGIEHPLRIQGIGESHKNTSKRVNLLISSRITAFKGRIEALVLPTIVSQQPRHHIPCQGWKIPQNIPLADPYFYRPSQVDMLLGTGLFYSILSVGQIKLGKNMPILQNTLFGWIVGGEYPIEPKMEELTCGMITKEELFSSMEKFWEIEECPASSRPMTAAELKCEKHFASQHRKGADGRFIVKLPFREEVNGLGLSYSIAQQRLTGVERRLAKDKILKHEYINFMREYQRLGHMEEIPAINFKEPHYFLPHHAVLKPDSTTTKVRVVFDASAKTSTNVSLNDLLAIGPTIQDDVVTQLLRFRLYKYAFTADIEKMYRQVWVHRDDRRFQLILWREDPTQAVKVFQLNTITYGTSCAPYLAIRCLRQLAMDGEVNYPLASRILNKNFYVDDVLAGSDDIKTAVDQVLQLRELLGSVGFNLRKWCSNDPRLLRHVPEEDREVSLELTQSDKGSVKTMGLIWTPREDKFSLRVQSGVIRRVTKRIALADISKIFDPLGFIAPVTVTAKMFLQRLWQLKIDWDAALPQELHTEWTTFRAEFEQLNQIKISRHLYGSQKPRRMQVHIFADASEKAYGAVAYVRSINEEGTVIVRFLCAKSKVAPISQNSIPRLELCAAKLAAELMHRILTDLDLAKDCFHLWSDSTSVLGWINAQSSNYHTFVANRIAAIQRISTHEQWHYVTTKENPADIISRGLYPAQLVNNNFWFFGPKFIHAREEVWNHEKKPVFDFSLELRQRTKTVLVALDENHVMLEIRHNNSFQRLQRVVAYMLRCSKPRLPGSDLLGKANLELRPTELELALHCIVRFIQESEFQQHIQDIQRMKAVQQTSSLVHLSPFLDEKRILRVGGRLQSADITYDAKHPMLLPHKHPFTKLLLTNLHRQHMHCGVQTLIAISRQKFWIINGKTLARNVIHNCVLCTRAKPKLAEQIMGELPRDRVVAARPFLITGVDFFGPIYVHFKGRGRRPVKAYGSVFCCFSTKAIHLEIVSDLSTEAFIGALRRFIGRRGRCQKIYCDNATNFAGAKNALQEMSSIIHNEAAQQKILAMCSKNHIEFCFIPPRAPHFGGLWEAAVKSAKGLLHKLLASASLTYEEMETVFIEAEAILNSRPITPMSADPNDMTALTPGHFLIGEPLTAVTDPYRSSVDLSCLSRWNLVKELKNEFWRRWSLEYLNGLQHRYKWNKECENIKDGTMVIIKDDNLPPLKWALGRIERVITGADGRVRVADVRTATNTSRRPIHKLAPLPVTLDNTLENLQAPGESRDEKARSNSNSPPKALKKPQVPERSRSAEAGPSSTTSSKTRKRKNGSSLASLLLTCLVLPLVSTSTIKFVPFQGDPGIYFERIGMATLIANRWSLINFVDLRPLRVEAELTIKQASILSELCKAIKVKTVCNSTINQIKHELQIIEASNELLRAKHRDKRGILNVVGNVASDLFGVLDSRYAEYLSDTIDAVRSNEELLKRHMENQTMFLDRTITIMTKNQAEINQEFRVMNEFISKTTTELNEIAHQVKQQELSTIFNAMAIQSFIQLTRFKSIQEALIDIITDAHHGQLNPELITPKELQTQLQHIHSYGTKNSKLPLPIEDITQYYRLMTISHQLTENYAIFNVQIPLTKSTKFELLQLTAVPWHTNKTFTKLHLTKRYLVVDLLRENHMALSLEEVQNCKSMDQTLYLCPQLHPMHNHKSPDDQCALEILRTAKVSPSCQTITTGYVPYWTPLHEPNAWLYAVGVSEQLNIVCNNTPSQISIFGSGIARVGEGCAIKTPHLSIEGHGLITEVRQVAYTPICNISQATVKLESANLNFSLLHQQSNNDIQILQRELSMVKGISLHTVRPQDVHHYGVSYTLLLIVLCCVLCITRLYWTLRHLTKNIQPTPAPRIQIQADTQDVDGESEIITMYHP